MSKEESLALGALFAASSAPGQTTEQYHQKARTVLHEKVCFKICVSKVSGGVTDRVVNPENVSEIFVYLNFGTEGIFMEFSSVDPISWLRSSDPAESYYVVSCSECRSMQMIFLQQGI